jgi:carbamoyl-phosphate synthase large subunit
VKTIRVLFVGGGKRFSAAEKLIEAGRDLGLSVEIYAYEIGQEVPIADVATAIKGIRFSDENVVSDLADNIKKYSIDIALPYHDQAIGLLASLRDQVFVPTCDPSLVKVFGSKIQSAQFFRRKALLTPARAIKVPAIAKPELGSASKGLLRFFEQESLDDFLTDPRSQNYELQELWSGPEYSVDGYIALNSTFSHFAVRERLETLGGEVVRSRTVDMPEIDAVCQRMVEIPGVRGAITIQFIVDNKSGRCGLMEVNARYGGGMLTSLGAGVPWFHILLRDYLRIPQQPVEHRIGVLMVRSFREHYFTISK